MRAVLQRVSRSSVSVDGKITGAIGRGLLVLLGIARSDTEKQADVLLEKALNLRIFDDAEGKMNLSLLEAGGGLLVVSQFTLLADTRRCRRPSYTGAAPPDEAKHLYEYFVSLARKRIERVETGAFRAMMDVELINDGPVTIILDTYELS